MSNPDITRREALGGIAMYFGTLAAAPYVRPLELITDEVSNLKIRERIGKYTPLGSDYLLVDSNSEPKPNIIEGTADLNGTMAQLNDYLAKIVSGKAGGTEDFVELEQDLGLAAILAGTRNFLYDMQLDTVQILQNKSDIRDRKSILAYSNRRGTELELVKNSYTAQMTVKAEFKDGHWHISNLLAYSMVDKTSGDPRNVRDIRRVHTGDTQSWYVNRPDENGRRYLHEF